METVRVLGLLDNTLIIVTADHGHSIGDRRAYIGKRGYPSDPEVFRIPLLVREPHGRGAGTTCEAWVQHHDVAATILESGGVHAPAPTDGRSFLPVAFEDGEPIRDHATIGWGSALTVATDEWWFNCKVDGTGAFLYQRNGDQVSTENVAQIERETARSLFELGTADAGGTFPDYLLEAASIASDAPGCSPLALTADGVLGITELLPAMLST